MADYRINQPVTQNVSPVLQSNPLESLSQGIQSGSQMGFQARQLDALDKQRQTQALQQQVEARKNEEKEALEKLKFKTDLMSKGYFNKMSTEDKNNLHRSTIEDINKYLGANLNPNEAYHDTDSEVYSHLNDALNDKSLTGEHKKQVISSILMNAAQGGMDKEKLNKAMEISKMSLGGNAGEESSQVLGFQDNQMLVWNPKSKTSELQPLPGTGTFIPKTEPSKLQQQMIGNTEAVGLIDGIEQTIKGISGLSGGMKQLASKATAGAIAPEARLYQEQKPAIAVKLYRALTNDTRLSDADAAARAMPLLPDLYEAPKVQADKLQSLKNASEGRNNSIKELLSGEKGLKIGDIVDGYEYRGGNKADPKNWKKK